MQIRVYYEDTDAGGIVYHSNYLNFCERARSEIFFKNGLSPHQENQFFVVKNIEADFKNSAKLGDILNVSTELLESKRFYIILKQSIFKDELEIFSMNLKLVYLKNQKLSSIPKNSISLFQNSN
jgi:acyl-CoA thioester hydrolase